MDAFTIWGLERKRVGLERRDVLGGVGKCHGRARYKYTISRFSPCNEMYLGELEKVMDLADTFIKFCNFLRVTGFQMLCDHATSGHQKLRVFFERKDPHHMLFCQQLSIVAIYAFFERLSHSFEQKSSCFRRAFNESHPDFVELSSKDILILLS